MWLYVGLFGVKELFDVVDGELFYLIYYFIVVVLVFVGVVFGVFVG